MFAITLLFFSLLLGILELEKNQDYEKIGGLMGNFIETLKISIGDFGVLGFEN